MKTTIYHLMSALFICFSFTNLFAQSVIYMENFGTPSVTTTIQQYTGWLNHEVTYSGDGTCDIRITNVSSGYEGASGGGNLMLNNRDKWFSISGIYAEGYDSLFLMFGMRKGSTAEDGSNLAIHYSLEGDTWERLPIIRSLPTGSGTTGWYKVTIAELPTTNNLHLKFSNLGTGDIRIDDISILGYFGTPTPSLRVNSPTNGNSYVDSVHFDFTLTNFQLGVDGFLTLSLSGNNLDTIFSFSSQSELTHFTSTPLTLLPGNYNLTSRLLDMDSEPLHPGVSFFTQFSIVMPTVATPEISPTGGVYSEAQTVQISCATENAAIYYTLDGSTPDDNGILYVQAIVIGESCTLKAIAMAMGMQSSEVVSAQYTIREYSEFITLPFDISGNSENEKEDIGSMDGFYVENLGTPYADGSAKFEQSKAGSAQLYVMLDSSPDTLWFDLRGRNGGTAPHSYEGVVMELSESSDKITWNSIMALTENEISNTEYTRFATCLSPETRYVKWFLAQADKGNTQLNNIKINKYSAPIIDTTEIDDTTFISRFDETDLSIYPNPAQNIMHIKADNAHIQEIHILNLVGIAVKKIKIDSPQCTISIEGMPSGVYLAMLFTDKGVLVRKIIKQ